jgi:hypothetical protein
LDFSRLRSGEIVAVVGGVALFIFMFFDWFGGGVEITTGGTQEVPGIGEVPTGVPSVEETGVSGWDALEDFSGFLIALAAVSGVALGGLAAAGRRLNLGGVERGAGTAALGSLAVLLILWRFFANPGDLKIGIFLGLAAAITIAIGALIALLEQGFEPLVKVPGGRTKAASASAPAATPSPRPVTAPGDGPGSSGTGSSAARSGGTAKKTRSSGGSTATKSRSGGSKATKSRSGGSTATKSGSGGQKTTAKRGTASKAKSSGSSRSKTSGSSRSKASGSGSRSKSTGSRSRSKSSSSRSRSKSSGTRRRSSGGRK